MNSSRRIVQEIRQLEGGNGKRGVIFLEKIAFNLERTKARSLCRVAKTAVEKSRLSGLKNQRQLEEISHWKVGQQSHNEKGLKGALQILCINSLEISDPPNP